MGCGLLGRYGRTTALDHQRKGADQDLLHHLRHAQYIDRPPTRANPSSGSKQRPPQTNPNIGSEQTSAIDKVPIQPQPNSNVGSKQTAAIGKVPNQHNHHTHHQANSKQASASDEVPSQHNHRTHHQANEDQNMPPNYPDPTTDNNNITASPINSCGTRR